MFRHLLIFWVIGDALVYVISNRFLLSFLVFQRNVFHFNELNHDLWSYSGICLNGLKVYWTWCLCLTLNVSGISQSFQSKTWYKDLFVLSCMFVHCICGVHVFLWKKDFLLSNTQLAVCNTVLNSIRFSDDSYFGYFLRQTTIERGGVEGVYIFVKVLKGLGPQLVIQCEAWYNDKVLLWIITY